MIIPVSQDPITPNHLIQSVGEISSGTSVLFLFSPRTIVDHHKRSLQYNFNNEMTNAITEHIVNQPSASNSIRKVMNTLPSINTAIIPSARDGIDIRTSAYSDNWMFVLIFDDDTNQSPILSNKILTRTILIGICANEPLSHSGFSSMTPEQFLDQSCRLIVTKRLKMSKFGTLGANGYSNRISTIADDNIVQFNEGLWGGRNLLPQTDESSYFTIMPGDINKQVNVDSDCSITHVIDYSDTINVRGSARITAPLESPRQHMKELLTAFETGVANVNYSDKIGTFSDSEPMFDEPSENFTSYVKSALDENQRLCAGNGMSTIGDITTMPLSIGMIQQAYHPKLFVINTPTHTNAEIIPQHYSSINNIFSSLVCAVLPTFLNQIGLSAIAFMYNSANDAFKVLHIESVVNVSQVELQYKWRAFEFLIKTELFPVLSANGGEFDLQVMSSVNSTTDVVLNFMDWSPLPNGAIYQENSILGGIVSPLVGTANTVKSNSLQLNNLISNVSAYVGDNVRSSNY